jgi:hypothetical protein
MPTELPPLLKAPTDEQLDPQQPGEANRGDRGHRIDLTPDLSGTFVTVTDPTRSEDTTGSSGLPEPGEIGLTTGLTGNIPPAAIKVKTGRFSAAASLQTTIAPQQSEVLPDMGVDLEAYINGTRVAAGRLEEAGPNITVQDVLSGDTPGSSAMSMNKKGDIGVNLVAFNELRYLRQQSITQSYRNARLSKIVNDIYDAANISGEVRLNHDPRLSPNYQNQQCRLLLTQLAHSVRGVFRVNARGSGNRIVFTDNPRLIRHNIGGVLKMNTGLQTAPYDGVVFTGGIPASAGGGGTGGDGGGPPPQSFTQNPIRATAGDTGPNARVYRTKNTTVHTQLVADMRANSFLDEFKRQQRQGKIVLAGNAAIQPFDTVTLPPSLGGNEFAVSRVEHTLSTGSAGAGTGETGFRTTVWVNGVIDGERGPGQPVMVRREDTGEPGGPIATNQ